MCDVAVFHVIVHGGESCVAVQSRCGPWDSAGFVLCSTVMCSERICNWPSHLSPASCCFPATAPVLLGRGTPTTTVHSWSVGRRHVHLGSYPWDEAKTTELCPFTLPSSRLHLRSSSVFANLGRWSLVESEML